MALNPQPKARTMPLLPPNSVPHASPPTPDASTWDIGDSVLCETDLKWLLTGMGWWIDAARLRTDPTYAQTVVHQAMQHGSDTVRQSAALLQMQLQSKPTQPGGQRPPTTPQVQS